MCWHCVTLSSVQWGVGHQSGCGESPGPSMASSVLERHSLRKLTRSVPPVPLGAPAAGGGSTPAGDAHLYFVLQRARHTAEKRRLIIWWV